jgi:hypothetical protein
LQEMIKHYRNYRSRRGQRGSFILETAIVLMTLLILLMGVFQMGLMLIRAMQAGELCRNANVLMVQGIDLSTSQNQQLLLRTAPALGINTPGVWTANSSGSGVVILSKVMLVGPLECSVGVSPFDGTTKTCPNLGSYVITYRINIGNTSEGSSFIGNPSSTPNTNSANGLVGSLTDAQICTVTGNQTTTFSPVLALSSDSFSWVAEVYADSKNFNLFSVMAAPTIYMRNFS